MRRPRRSVVVVLPLVLLVVLGAPAATLVRAAAVELDAEVYGAEVEVGFGGEVVPGAWTPVEVRLAPRRPVAATLSVESRTTTGSLVSRERDIEVAGGARTVHRFVVPGGIARVLLTEGEGTVVLDRPSGTTTDRFLVGRLGQPPQPAPPLQSEPTGRQGVWVGVDPGWLSEPMALESLSALVVDGAELAALGTDAERALAAAVARGLSLVVVADADGPVAAPPGAGATSAVATSGEGGRRLEVTGPAWRIERGGAVVAAALDVGLGRVVYSGLGPTPVDAALWSELAGPRASSASSAGSEADIETDPWLFGQVMSGSDTTVPTVPWLAAFLAAYILVVGPVNGIVLHRMRRQELAWVTVPLVTVVFTVAAFAGATGGRPPVGSAARVVWSVDGAAQELVAVALRTPQAGTRAATLPGADWATTVLLDAGGMGTSTAEVAPVTGGVEASLDLAALELGGVVAIRPTDDQPPLRVAAVADPGGGLVVTVTNVGDRPLDEVSVRAATLDRRVGALAPGEEQEVVIDQRRLPLVEPYQDPLAELGGLGGPASPPSSLEALLRGDALDGDPGLVWAVGSSARSATGVTVDGDPAREDGTLFAVATRATLPPEGGVGPFAVGRELVSGGEQWRPGPQAVEGVNTAVLRYRLPAGAQVDQLHEDLTRSSVPDVDLDLDLWDVVERRWVPLAQAVTDDVAAPDRFVSPLGEVHVRATGDLFPFEFSGRTVATVPVGGGGS